MGLSILVVDDECVIALELEQILRDAGAEVVGPALCLEDAIALAESARSISAAVLDVRLGADSIAPVASLLAARGAPILFYTGQMPDDPILRHYPRSAYLAKPSSAGRLVARLQALARPNEA